MNAEPFTASLHRRQDKYLISETFDKTLNKSDRTSTIMNKTIKTLPLLSLFLLFFFLAGSTSITHAVESPSASDTTEQPADEQKALLSQIAEGKQHLVEMRKGMKGLMGEQQLAAGMQIREAETELRDTLGTLIKLINKERQQGLADTETIEKTGSLISEESQIIRHELDYVQGYINDLQKGQADLEPVALLARKQEISKNRQIYDDLLKDLYDNTDRMKDVGISSKEDFAYLDELINNRAMAVAGEIKLMSSKAEDLKKQIVKVSGDKKAEIQTSIEAVEEEKRGATKSLTHLVELMHARNMDATEYGELLINETGQISREILDVNVAYSLFKDWMLIAEEWLHENGIGMIVKIIFIVLILLMFKLLSGITKRVVRRAIDSESSTLSKLMGDFFVTMSGKLVMLIGIMVALSQLGIKIAPMLAGLGIAGFIIGFALQDVLSNFASGIMILIYQPFDVGDTIEVPEVSGRVQHMNLVSTIILTFDNQKLVVPNNKIWGNIIRNIHAERLRRVDLSFGIGYQDNISHAEQVLREIVEEHELILKSPEPVIKLHALNESSVDFIVRPWTNTENYWEVYWDVTRRVKERFDSEGISIPFPQRAVHIQQQPAPGSTGETSFHR